MKLNFLPAGRLCMRRASTSRRRPQRDDRPAGDSALIRHKQGNVLLYGLSPLGRGTMRRTLGAACKGDEAADGGRRDVLLPSLPASDFGLTISTSS